MLARDQSYVDPPARPENGYHRNEDLAEQAIAYLRELRAYREDLPFLLYYATGAAHDPHHALREQIDRFRGRFDAGRDVWREEVLARQKAMGLVPEGTEVSPRPSWVTPWESLSDRERRFCTRTMEVFAGFLSHTDNQSSPPCSGPGKVGGAPWRVLHEQRHLVGHRVINLLVDRARDDTTAVIVKS